MTLYLTSSPTGAYREAKQPSYKGFNPENRLVDNLKEDWKEQSRCLLICANPDAYMQNNEMRFFFEKTVKETGLSVSAFDVCDSRNGEEAVKNLRAYDVLILGGGHVPTQNRFFQRIGLIQAIKGFDGIVMGISAGTMNCAGTVYAQPEMPGESTSKAYRRFLEGLGLTRCNVLPHYQAVKGDVLDGKRLMEDITYPDSFGRKFYALPDGSYILQKDGAVTVFGEAYLVAEGEIRKICSAGESLILHKRRQRYQGTHPRRFEEKYKEHEPEKYADTIEKVISKGSTPAGMHISICVEEILEVLKIRPGEKGIDLTLGYGGHTRRMLEQLKGQGHMWGLDVDPIEIRKTKERLNGLGYGEDILTVIQENFSEIARIGKEYGPFDFVLADLGVSSMQIDNPERGFSYKTEGPLDLRLNPEQGVTAAERLLELSEEEIAGMLAENADEPYAQEIAGEIAGRIRRGRKPETTAQLREAVEAALAFLPEDKQKKDVVKKTCQRVFQAIRIDVNSEFEVLEAMLAGLPEALAPGGRAAILTFHSGEDRLVKKAFKRFYKEGIFCDIAKDVIRPSAEECRRNGRAGCAKLRWAVKAEM